MVIEYTINQIWPRIWRRADFDSNVQLFEQWRKLLEDYSGRHLSYENDRLPALSGLATHLKLNGAGEYLAGF
jgi:hypothetical protein